MHLRNKSGRTPLFVAAQRGFRDNVVLLRSSGAHLNPEEVWTARLLASRNWEIWLAAGLDHSQSPASDVQSD